ncbi:MAG TPA: basic amino acid/polyamine antiporter [Rickettsiales bacterium]|nr:basic amino acid/polyamine antiporter [Rickettsiales bacterium]
MQDKKVGTIILTAIIFSSMVGGGIFSIPQNIARTASLGAGIIAWLIASFGMFCIANVFINLSKLRPNLNTGIYSYAENGFGKFIGFATGWSYLVCNYFVVISLAVMSASALDYFFPTYFTGGNNLLSVICLSITIWIFNFIVLRGFKFSATFNVIATILKFITLIIFIFVMLFVFDWSKFTLNFWGNNDIPIFKQITSSLLVTLWCFIGVETGSTLSSEAKNQKIVSNSTILSFFMCLVLYIALSTVPYGFLTQEQIAKVPDPSAAGILEMVLGKYGAFIINLGVLIAILSCWFSWILVLVEIPSKMAENNNFPKQFLNKNKNGISYYSTYLTSIIAQIGILVAFFSSNAWIMMQSLSGVMIIPAYLFSSLYLIKIAKNSKLNVFFSLISCIFLLLISYSCSIGYIVADFILLVLAIPLFYLTHKNDNTKHIFTKNDKIISSVLIIIGILAIFSLIFGFVKIPNLL